MVLHIERRKKKTEKETEKVPYFFTNESINAIKEKYNFFMSI